MKASMMLVAAVAAIAGTVDTVAAQPTAQAAASPQQLAARAAAASVSRRTISAKPVRLTVVNQSQQAIHTNPQDGWEGDLQPGESKDFHSGTGVGGSANSKSVIITNYPAPQDGVSCTPVGWNPSIGAPSMFANCYNTLTGEAVVSQWSYTKVDAGSCGYVTDSTGHVYADFCREGDVDGYKHFTYYVYGN